MKVKNLFGEIHTISKTKTDTTIKCDVTKDGELVLSFNVPANAGWLDFMIGKYAMYLLGQN